LERNMTHRTAAFHRLSRADAATLRTRGAPRAKLTFDDASLGSGSVRLAVDHGELRREGYDTCLSLTWGVDRLELHCPVSLLWQVLRAFDSALEVEAIPSDLAALLLEVALLPLIVHLEQATGRDITINGVRPESLDAAEGGLGLLLEKDNQRWGLLLFARPVRSGGSDPLAALLGFWPVVPRHMLHFRVAAALRIGATQLSFAAFKSLQLGDAVLLQIGDGSNGMLVVAEAWTAIAEQRGHVWRLVEALKPAAEIERKEWTMRSIDEAEEAPENSPINDPDQLPVHLTFDVGRLEISLAELRRLGPGSVIELARSIAAPVRISAQGRPVGHGELIDIEGVVGVKITKLFDYE
jgi:type III secretion protein Q